jgi:hypothetical protein
MQSRFPVAARERAPTPAKYTVCHGFSQVFENFAAWLAFATGAQVHGHLFAPDRAEFADGAVCLPGALTDNACLRDYNPQAFLTNLLWNSRGRHQCFQFCPGDNQEVTASIAFDPNATFRMITGAWAIPLSRTEAAFPLLRREAARLQKIEAAQLKILQSASVRARVQTWSLSEFLKSPMAPLHEMVEEIGAQPSRRLTEAPYLTDLEPVSLFVQRLRNAGMHPYLVGDISSGLPHPGIVPEPRATPQLVR